MEFDRLLGNEPLKSRLHTLLRRGQTPHCWLLCGPEGSGKRTLAGLLCEALECTAPEGAPCGVCAACRKVRAGDHPDVVTVEETERQSIPVERIRALRADAFVRPNEGRRKIYVFPRAEQLSDTGQNALLKLLEEPPSYAVFLLLVPNAGLLLPTVRSRCAALSLSPLPEGVLLPALRTRTPGRTEEEYRSAAASGWLGQAIAALEQTREDPAVSAFAAAFAARDGLALLELLTASERLKRDALLERLQSWERLLTLALRARYSGESVPPSVRALRSARTAAELLRAVNAVRQAELYCNANVSAGAVCGALCVQLS